MKRRSGLTVAIVMGLLSLSMGHAESQPDLSSSVANTLTHTGISAPIVASVGLTCLGNERQAEAEHSESYQLVFW